MKKTYYAVTVKFGHVGRAKYLIKTVPTIAEDGKKAAEYARWMSRAKHHAKDAILSVTKISEEEYNLLKEEYNNDPYFHCKNIQQQRVECVDYYLEIQSMKAESDDEEHRINRKMRIEFQQKKYKEAIKDYGYARNHCSELYAY